MHINFSEILVILIVALLVIKPEKWPEVATALGRCLRGMQAALGKMNNRIEIPAPKYSYQDQDSIAQQSDKAM